MRPETISTLLSLGRPEPALGMPAFFDCHPDDILFSNSNVHLTVGDVRELQSYLRALGHRQVTRTEALLIMASDESAPQ